MTKSRASSGKIFYCYALLDTRKPGRYRYQLNDGFATFEYEPFYIGKGTKGRSDVHIPIALNTNAKKKRYSKIRKIYRLGFTVEVKRTKTLMKESDAFDLERQLIKAIGRSDLKQGPLTNATDGGEGKLGHRWTEEQKQHRRNTFRHTPESRAKIGRPATPEQNAKRVATRRATAEKNGYYHSAESRAKMSARAKGRKNSPEARAKMSAAKKAMPVVECPHCGKKGKGGAMKVHHFDNCRFI